MRDYGRIYSAFWTSTDIREMSDDGKLLALYLLSGPHGTIAGVCRLPALYVSEDLGWPVKRVSEGFAELFRNGFCNRCETTNWVWIRKFLVWNRPENPNQWKAARKIADQVPEKCAFLREFIAFFDAVESGETPEFVNPCETLSEGLPTQEQEQEQEQDIATVPKPRRGKGKPPPKTTIPDNFPDFPSDPELAGYVQKHLPGVDLPAFSESYRAKAVSKGWMYSSWRAAVQDYARNCAPNSGHWSAGQYPKAEAIKWV